MVVAFHAGLPVHGGFVGVDVFFVISGFVITAMLQREWAANGRLDLKQFYLRRFKRLTPALALTLSFTAVAGVFLLSPFGSQQTTAKTALGAVLLSANFVIARTTGGYFDAPAETNPLLNTWSLSVEEQFYLAFPALLGLAWSWGRRRGRTNAALIAIGIIGTISLAAALLGVAGISFRGSQTLLGFYSPISRTWEFAVGALLALAGDRLSVGPKVKSVLGFVGLGLLIASLFVIDGGVPFPGPWTFVPVVGTLLLLVAGTESSGALTRALSSKPMVKIGDWSYSIYLWHWPLIVLTAVLWPANAWAKGIAALGSVIPALASYRWVEEPLRANQASRGTALARLLVAVLAPPVTAAALLASVAQPRFQSPEMIEAMKAVTTTHAPNERGCMERGPFTPELVSRCVWSAEHAENPPVYLVGDSNAWHFAEGVIDSARDAGRQAWVFTTPSCPLIDALEIAPVGRSRFFPGPWPAQEFAHCRRFSTFTLDWLGRARSGVVLVAALDQYWWDPSLAVGLDGEVPNSSMDHKLDVLRRGLTNTVKTLQSAGHRVVLIQSVPTFRNPAPIWEPRACPAFAVSRSACGRSVPTNTIDAVQAPSRRAIEEVAVKTGADLLDLRKWFCGGGECTTHRDGAWLYMDATHITVSASHALAREFSVVTALREVRERE
jgi:peptidoglycan/LPS O-acetylase OafA/YrhL